MPYYKMLKKVISKTNYTQEEIAKQCEELGVTISKSYINKIINDKLPAPTEDVSRAIAKACNCDERLLVLEGYLDKAPKEIKQAFLSLKNTMMLYSIHMFENKIDKKTINEVKEKFEEEPLADFVLELIENGNNEIISKEIGIEIEAKNKNLICNLTKPISLKVEDNAMFPLIKENDEVTIEIKDRYINGDIIAVNVPDHKGVIIRQAVFLGRGVELVPLNKEYEHKTYNDKKDIIILGKVKKIITEI